MQPAYFKKFILQNSLLLFSGIFIFLYFFKPIETEDIWGHLSTGRWIVEHGQVPHVDVFPFGNERVPWSCHNEWLGSVILFLVFKSFGFLGLKVFRSLFFSFIISILFRYSYRHLPFPFLIIFIYLVTLGVFSRCFLKPDMFNLLFIQIILINLFNYENNGHRKSLWILPVITCIWFNIHMGALIYGLSLISIFLVSACIRYLFLKLGQGNPIEKGIAKNQVKDLSVTLLACFASFILNPYGIDGFLYPFKVFLLPKFIGFYKFAATLQENQSPWYIFQSFSYFYYFALFAFAIFVLFFNKKNNLTFILLLLFSSIAFLSVTRNSAFFTLVSAYVFVVGAKQIKFNDLWQRLPYLKIIECLLFLGTAIFLLFQISDIWVQKSYINGQITNNRSLLKDPYSESSIQLLIKNKILGPVFNADGLGGQMIWLGYPDLRPFRDTRNNSYERVNNALVIMTYPQEDWPKEELHYGFKIVMLSPQRDLEEKFLRYLNTQSTWQLIAVNGTLVTYVKRGEFNLPKELDSFEASIKSRGISINDLQTLKRLLEKRNASMIQQFFLPIGANIDLYLDFVSLYDLGYHGAAIKDLVKALEISNQPEIRAAADLILKHYSASAFNSRAAIDDARGDFNHAILDYSNAIKLNPNIAEFYLNRGNAYNRQGKLAEAIEDYNEAIALKPNYATAYDNLTVTYYQLKEFDKAWASERELEKLSGSYDPRRISLIKKVLAERK